MQMTDAEILSSYKGAKDPKAQITVLADLNGVCKAEMAQKLRELGVHIPEAKPRPSAMDELRAAELYRAGACDLDIAEQLGCKKTQVTEWRKRSGLAANYPQHRAPAKKQKAPDPEPGPAVPEPSGTMTAARMAQVLGQIAKWHPEARVTVGRLRRVPAFNACTFSQVGRSMIGSWTLRKMARFSSGFSIRRFIL